MSTSNKYTCSSFYRRRCCYCYCYCRSTMFQFACAYALCARRHTWTWSSRYKKCHWLGFTRFFVVVDRTLVKRNMKKRLYISSKVLFNSFRQPYWCEHFSWIALSINQRSGKVGRRKVPSKQTTFLRFLNVCSEIFGSTFFNHLSIFCAKVKNK